MNDGWTHGVLDISTMDLYIFWFGHSNKDGRKRTEKILEYIVPFVTEAYKRINSFQSVSDSVLTAREKEVLYWIKEGKGSWEISVILNCSKRVIDFHVTNMKRKLNVTNRPQLVAAALSKRIIEF
jgi:DNA-binding CsgD family transcriptional regulator